MEKEWKYAVVGNVVRERLDENGILKHGTVEFQGGAKLYLYGKYWSGKYDVINTIGFSRFRKWRVVALPIKYIENLRIQKVYKPRVLEIMNDWEFKQGWWGNTDEDIYSINEFLQRWNNRK